LYKRSFGFGRACDDRRRRPNGVVMFVTNRDVVAGNATGVEIMPGGVAYVEDAARYSVFGRR
jgi:hypothetical protein